MVENVKETRLYQWLFKKDSKFLNQVDQAIRQVEDMLEKINNAFSSYTIHGIKHSVNVMEYMFSLINDIDLLSELEVTVLIYSALFHDIGMVVSDEEIAAIKSDDTVLGDRKYSKVFEKYGDEMISLQECIRPVHGRRSREYIENELEKVLLLLPDSTVVSFENELGLICESHNEDFEWLEKNLTSQGRKGDFEINAQYIAMLLRIADYLDIDEKRAPMYLYKYLKPKEYSDLEWKQHFVIENYEKVLLNEKTGIKEIVFNGTSKDPSVHRKLLKYFDSINEELENAVNLSERFTVSKYLLSLKTNVINKIRTQGFSFSDLRLSLDYNAVTNLLMGEHIYGDKKYGLRELIQNSIDACKTMEESSLQMEEFRYQKYEPFISIILDKDRKQVVISDNGSGMSIEILKKYFLNVGVSYYASDDYLLQGREYSPIGHYGIGFLACFMLSDKVEVKTVYYKEHKTNRISFEKNSEYICLTYENDNGRQGTEIILDYDQYMSVFNNKVENMVSFIEQNFLDSDIPVRVSTMEKGKSNNIKCNIKKVEEIIPEHICLNDYLHGVEAYVDCTYKQINFARHLKNLNGYDSYYYNDEQNTLEREYERSIKDCVEEGKIHLTKIPVIQEDEEMEFIKAYEVLEDYDEALGKKDTYDTINIWTLEEELYNYKSLIEEEDEVIVGDYTLEDFKSQFNHSELIPVQKSHEEVSVIVTESDMVLPYKEDCLFFIKYFWENTDRCYVKNVLLSEVKVKIPFLVDGIKLKGMVINITNPEFVPNVSRSNVGDAQQKKLNYAIGKALHMWIRDNASLDAEQRELLDLFIRTKYDESNSCLK